MSTRNSEETRAASGNEQTNRPDQREQPGQPGQTRPTSPPTPGGAIGDKPRMSLASRITSSYNRMLILCMSIGLFIMLAATAWFDYSGLVREAKPTLDQIKGMRRLEDMAAAVNAAEDLSLVLLDEEYVILASNFPQIRTVSYSPVYFLRMEDGTYMARSGRVDLPGGHRVYLQVFFHVSWQLKKLLFLCGAGVLIFGASLAVIGLRGRLVTRKTFGVIDEMISKASSISSQNLNLRLNVSDATDELLKFALTFNRMMDRIEKAYEKQNQFVSDASHELRTPISVIQGYAGMLERWGKEDREILDEAISAIKKESVNMQDLVEKLLFIARNDQGSLLLVKEHFNLSDMMEELVKETRMLNTGHEIKSNVPPGIKIYGDAARIKQALRIFADNALKFTPSDGTVTFRLDQDDGYAVAVVEDTGVGIPEKDLPRIFDRFYRVDAARERNTGGHGLGLSIARIIILRHGGRIRIASREGEGTRFFIYLPIGDGVESQPQED
ncbi:MAG TPA: ATP-binding protein [Thermoclostridium sp.]|nr:ATP-binding protein [Thermoclostridium sp.]HPU45431.1 ATP-binding protein [Thermoclostridium sp.]